MPTRRDLLRIAGIAAATLTTACRRSPRVPGDVLVVPLADLPEGVHVMRLRDNEPIDILRTGDRIVVRSLFCTHMGCIVAWNPEANGYTCPCHGGAYDADGVPSAGPPPAPLRQLPTSVEGRQVVISPSSPHRPPRVTS